MVVVLDPVAVVVTELELVAVAVAATLVLVLVDAEDDDEVWPVKANRRLFNFSRPVLALSGPFKNEKK